MMAPFFLTVYILLANTLFALSDDPEVYVLVSDYRAIYRIQLHNFEVHRLEVNVTAPFAIDYDHRDGRIYFTEVFTRQIRRVDINGTNDEEVAAFNSSSSPEGLTLDEETREVFYTDNGNDLIGKVNMDTLTHTVIVNTGLDRPRGIVADTKNKKLYWADYGDNEKIERSNYNGGQRSLVLSLGISIPLGITLDERGRLYWTDGFNEKIYSVRVDGTGRETVLNHADKSLSMISFYNGFLYYTDFDDTDIFIHPLGTPWYIFLSPAQLLRPRGLHVFSPNFDIRTNCPNGRYGGSCVACGNCEDDVPCEKTTGVCLHGCDRGYRSLHCDETCQPGTYGLGCNSTCNCGGLTCDHITGRCPVTRPTTARPTTAFQPPTARPTTAFQPPTARPTPDFRPNDFLTTTEAGNGGATLKGGVLDFNGVLTVAFSTSLISLLSMSLFAE